ncbi:tail fiber protein [Pseudoalteromonas xiamenensis]|uniref:phage tail protein n=1 Tax=Pseudoalteromonas xiamenensis TaxID=882626 RepID=UPI0027E3B6E9|nr:tail fiber protein [Pseudoalteromonas xiamenensis]WMN59037.1 tail fiber protein [Pseudoalteromonas xiamenensis]
MSADSYIGTMRPFGGIFAIRDWAICQGQLLAISENTALFSLIGDNYGGDARTTFGLPDMRGRSPVGMGTMPGGRTYQLGLRFGMEDIALNSLQLPEHSHAAVFVPSGGSEGVTASLQAATNPGNSSEPSEGAYISASTTSVNFYKAGGLSPEPTLKEISGLTIDGSAGSGGTVDIGDSGKSQSFSILNPGMVVNWQIVLEGIYPPRS